jgi:predicted transcriptional regulator
MGKRHFANRKSLLCAMGEHSNHVRRLPQILEDRELRIIYWRTLMTLLRVAHVSRFPNHSFGKTLHLIVVYGAVILAFIEGRKSTIASIARYLELPHETTRRYLKTVVDLGLLAQDGRSYKPTERSRKRAFNADKIERLLRQAASELYL